MNSYMERQLGPLSERPWAGGTKRKVSSLRIGDQKRALSRRTGDN